MWFTREVVVASVFMMIICCSESKPQAPVSDIPTDDSAFISLLLGGTGTVTSQSAPAPDPPVSSSGSGQCSCVPLLSCCESPPNSGSPNPVIIDDLVNVRQTNQIIDMGQHQNSLCEDILTVCCEEMSCKETKSSESSSPVPSPSPVPSNQCGIRNNNGVSITITGMKERQSQLGEFPWMVAVFADNGSYVGGGSLVHPRVVLTAGHKVHGLSHRLVARIGDWDITHDNEVIRSQNINVEKILIHKDFHRPTMQNNVALLILQRDAELSDTVMPICLPQPGQVFDGAECIVTGWGKDMFGKTGRYQTIMKKVSVPAVSHSECQRMLRNTRLGSTFHLDSTFNCAGGQGEDACEGDGGSPLVCPNPNKPDEYVQMGVVAWGIGCGEVGNPGVYGSVPQTVDWITQTFQREIGTGVGNAFDERIVGF